MNRIPPDFESYLRAAYPPAGEISELQRQEVRRAFYAGARSLLTLVDPRPGVDAFELHVESEVVGELEAELNAFARSVLDGRA